MAKLETIYVFCGTLVRPKVKRKCSRLPGTYEGVNKDVLVGGRPEV